MIRDRAISSPTILSRAAPDTMNEQTSTGDTRWEFAWEVKDGVVTTTRNAIGASFLTTFEVDDSGTSLVCISGNIDEGPYWKQES